MLRWRSLGGFRHLIFHGAGRSLVHQCPELVSPTSEAQRGHMAGSTRAFWKLWGLLVLIFFIIKDRDFPGSPVLGNSRFQCRQCGFNP